MTAVHVVTHTDWAEVRKASRGVAASERIRTVGAMFVWQGDPTWGFLWECPGCGGAAMGKLGDVPVSGWDEPRWVNTGTELAPTLSPSLGCRGLLDGTCTGHYWLREGELINA